MPPRRHLRTIITVLAAMLAVVGLTLSMTGPAQGTGNCGPVEFTLKTDADGYYQLWLAKDYNPLQVIAAKDGFTPKSKAVRITAGGTVTADLALKKS